MNNFKKFLIENTGVRYYHKQRMRFFDSLRQGGSSEQKQYYSDMIARCDRAIQQLEAGEDFKTVNAEFTNTATAEDEEGSSFDDAHEPIPAAAGGSITSRMHSVGFF